MCFKETNYRSSYLMASNSGFHHSTRVFQAQPLTVVPLCPCPESVAKLSLATHCGFDAVEQNASKSQVTSDKCHLHPFAQSLKSANFIFGHTMQRPKQRPPLKLSVFMIFMHHSSTNHRPKELMATTKTVKSPKDLRIFRLIPRCGHALLKLHRSAARRRQQRRLRRRRGGGEAAGGAEVRLREDCGGSGLPAQDPRDEMGRI